MAERVRIIHDPDRTNRIGGPLFAKGNQASNGRAKGVPNKLTTLLKDAIIRAAEEMGHLTARTNGDGAIKKDSNGRIIGWRKGKDGLIGYLTWLGMHEPRSFATLLGKVIPLHIVGDVEHTHRQLPDKEALEAELRARGLPTSVFEHKRLMAPTTKTQQ